MAKLTKLNIGDSVASGGGRAWKKLSAKPPEPEITSIEGTWVLKSSILRTMGSPNGEMMTSGINTSNITGSMYVYDQTAGRMISTPIQLILIGSATDFGNTSANRTLFRLLSNSKYTKPYYTKEIFFETAVGHYISEVYWSSSGNKISRLYSGANWTGETAKNSIFDIESENGVLMRTFTITNVNLSTDEYNLILAWLKANATKTA